jgi:O-antigen/teichoic acid export membrane protein
MNSRIIARNSYWYGIETFTNLFLTFFTSIVVARSVGPTKLGYFLYLWWMAGVAGTVGSLGIPAATRKYVSEYFGRGQMGIARTVFYRTLRLQSLLAGIITAVALSAMWFWGDREYRVIGLLMLGSIFPYMLNMIAAGANTALEDLRANVPASLVSTAIFVTAVFSSVWFGWELLGISIGLLTMRSAELAVRIIPLMRRLNQYAPEPVDQSLEKRMFRFSGQSLFLMVLGLIVWDRSELVALKNFCADIRQVAFYSVAFNITERLLVISQVFGTATGATMMVQYGRDCSKVRGLIATTLRYLAVISFPLHLGLAAIAGPVMWIVYGAKYSEAVPALIIAACLGIPKAFMTPVQSLLSSWERQDLLLRWGVISGVINVALDFALIPKYGAVGAAIANGTTQTFSAIALWVVATRLLQVQAPMWPLLKTLATAGTMALVAHFAAASFSAIPAVVIAVLIGAAVYLLLLRLSRILDHRDRERLFGLVRRVPMLQAGISWIIPAVEANA